MRKVDHFCHTALGMNLGTKAGWALNYCYYLFLDFSYETSAFYCFGLAEMCSPLSIFCSSSDLKIVEGISGYFSTGFSYSIGLGCGSFYCGKASISKSKLCCLCLRLSSIVCLWAFYMSFFAFFSLSICTMSSWVSSSPGALGLSTLVELSAIVTCS